MKLVQYNSYSREDVHNIFSPNTRFSRGAGIWGIQGIIKVPETPKDYIFMVTYGMSQGDHTFDEGINKEGILTWQSQPRQDMTNNDIKNFINHDELDSNIYLLLRTSKKNSKYVYLGKLKYLVHDNTREKPVHFKWQILNWNSELAEKSLNILLSCCEEAEQTKSVLENGSLNLREKPNNFGKEYYGVKTARFHLSNIDFEEESRKKTKLGIAGEDAVVLYEKNRLIIAGREELAEKVKPTRDTLGNNAPYDIVSYDENSGNEIFIEVKTTQLGANTSFYASLQEVLFSEQEKHKYYLYRVYNFDYNGSGEFYIQKGSLADLCDLKANNFKCKIK